MLNPRNLKNWTFGSVILVVAIAGVFLLGGASRQSAQANGSVRAATARAATQGFMARASAVQHRRVARITTHVLRGNRRALAGRPVTVRVTTHGHATSHPCGRTGRHGTARCRVHRPRGARMVVLVKAPGGRSLRVRIWRVTHRR